MNVALTNFIVVKVIQSFKWKAFLLNFLDDFLRKLAELSQWRHRLPPEPGMSRFRHACNDDYNMTTLKKVRNLIYTENRFRTF